MKTRLVGLILGVGALSAAAVFGCSESSSSAGPDGAGADGAGADGAGAPGGGGSGGSTSSVGAGGTGGTTSTTGGGGSGGDGGGITACEPTPGSNVVDGYCDLIRVAVIDANGAQPRLQVQGRINTFSDGCVVLDQVILGDDNNQLQVIATGGVEVHTDGYNQTLFEADPASAVSSMCQSESGRVEPFGFIASGRLDGGTFEARCGKATGGSSWPPDVVLTCHEGIAEQPYAASAYVDVWEGMGLSSTSLDAAYRDAPQGPTIVSVSGDIRIVPFSWSGMAPQPFDTTGWDGSVSDGSGYTSPLFFHDGDPLGTEVCPPYNDDPYADPPPLFIAKIDGQTDAGPFMSEVLVDLCDRIVTQ